MSSTNFKYEGLLLNYYEVLGVARNATMDEIRRAYRQLALKHHPDKGGDPATFKKVGHAYYILSDMQRREDYDDAYGFNAAPESESESDGEDERELQRWKRERELFDEELANEIHKDRDPERYWYNRADYADRRGMPPSVSRSFREQSAEYGREARMRRDAALKQRREAAEAQARAFAAARPAAQAEFDELLADLAKPSAAAGGGGGGGGDDAKPSAAAGGGGGDDEYLRKRRAQWAEAKRRQRARKNAAAAAETEAAVRAALASSREPPAPPSLFNDLAAHAARPEASWRQANAARAAAMARRPSPFIDLVSDDK